MLFQSRQSLRIMMVAASALVSEIIVSSESAAGSLSVTAGQYTLTSNESYEDVTIGSLASVATGGFTLTVTGEGGLTCSGALYIGGGGTLALSGGGSHSIGGSIQMLSSGSNITITNNNSTLTGIGQLIGHHDDATLTIASGIGFTTNININGGMLIAGTVTLRNYGIVNATLGRTIRLTDELTLIDDTDCVWSAESGTLKFYHTQAGNTALAGDFYLSSNGTLAFNAPTTTSGTFFMLAGTLSVADDAAFTYGAFATIECVNPGSGTGPYAVQGPATTTCPG